jgi:hypothetical protein
VRAVPPALLQHLGRELGVAAPQLASLRALYARGRTLFVSAPRVPPLARRGALWQVSRRPV